MKNVLSTAGSHGARHRLDPSRIIETAENLARDVCTRLPGTSLAGLACELVQIAHATDERAGSAEADLWHQGWFLPGDRRDRAVALA